MRYVLAATVALVMGIVVGGLRPRAELRDLQAQLNELKERECRSLLGSEIVRALQAVQAPSPPQSPSAPEAPPSVEQEPPPAAPEREQDDQEPQDDLAEGRTLLAARRAQARAALIEDADPSPEQLDRFDAAVADMNAELRALAEDLLSRVRELGDAPPRSELYQYAADGLAVVLETEAAIRDALGEQADDVDAEALDPLSHLDPGLVDLALELDRAGFDP